MATISIFAKRQSGEALATARKLRERFSSHRWVAERFLAEALGWEVEPDVRKVAAAGDVVVSLGGDGTLIRVAGLIGAREVPVVAVNFGRLGFLTEIPEEELPRILEGVLAGRFRTDSRMKLRWRLVRDNKVVVEDEALNEVVVNKGTLARIALHEVRIGEELLGEYKADGIIVATPTGSTAYSLSAGGPVVHPDIDCFVVTPICPHALTQRPVVLPPSRPVAVTLCEEADVYLTVDGQGGHALRMGDRVEIERSENRLSLVKNGVDYFTVLRSKLHWGER